MLLGYRSASRAYYPSTWGVLGGHVKSGETIAEALAREVREEAGVTATEYHLLDILREPDPDLYGEGEFHMYAVTGWYGSEPRPMNAEHEQFRWFMLAEARALRLPDPSYLGLFAKLERFVEIRAT